VEDWKCSVSPKEGSESVPPPHPVMHVVIGMHYGILQAPRQNGRVNCLSLKPFSAASGSISEEGSGRSGYISEEGSGRSGDISEEGSGRSGDISEEGSGRSG